MDHTLGNGWHTDIKLPRVCVGESTVCLVIIVEGLNNQKIAWNRKFKKKIKNRFLNHIVKRFRYYLLYGHWSWGKWRGTLWRRVSVEAMDTCVTDLQCLVPPQFCVVPLILIKIISKKNTSKYIASFNTKTN